MIIFIEVFRIACVKLFEQQKRVAIIGNPLLIQLVLLS